MQIRKHFLLEMKYFSSSDVYLTQFLMYKSGTMKPRGIISLFSTRFEYYKETNLLFFVSMLAYYYLPYFSFLFSCSSPFQFTCNPLILFSYFLRGSIFRFFSKITWSLIFLPDLFTRFFHVTLKADKCYQCIPSSIIKSCLLMSNAGILHQTEIYGSLKRSIAFKRHI